ncbi:DNA polymerase/3'-5' exonuclease PolX, partial [Candidatus Woesearchaeota archaeon]|nr:DNA polymerase/3'-5' exonuclease PolX [Candidatus Woesearchaeota archaeon]
MFSKKLPVMKNLEIARIMYHIADMLELQEVQFKPQAYRNAARSIENLSEDVKIVYERGELNKIPGIGEHIAQKIAEVIETGRLEYYEQLKKEVGFDIEQLLRIPTLGPKRIKVLHQELKINDLGDLEKAVKMGKLRGIRGFGEETEKHILEGIKLIRSKPLRYTYAQAQLIVEEIIRYFKKFNFVKKIEVAGSYRRGKETVGDLDFLVVSPQPQKVMESFIKLPDVKEVLARGATKSSIRLRSGMQIDVRVVQEKEFGSALLYFTGNKEHNIEVRKIALSKGYTLSEYGLFRLKPKKWVAGRSEEEIYPKLGLRYMEPELRENMGEIKAAQENRLPQIITAKEIKGVFHNHSTWSEGSNTLWEMAKKAEEMKLKFISFNDHYSNLGILRGLTEKRLTGYLKEIEKVRKKVGIRIFSGIEIDIQKDGNLTLAKNKLKELDVIIAAVHTSMDLPEAEMTKRVCIALEDYPINILGHPMGIKYGEREAMKLNLNKVFEVAKRNNVFMEVNSVPNRMDLSGPNVKSALDAGCRIAISTDAHEAEQLNTYLFGVLCARRGWVEKKNILNCWSISQI